jgi:uncharacterized membrane protein YdjX (TVP38/TMEM64 family)
VVLGSPVGGAVSDAGATPRFSTAARLRLGLVLLVAAGLVAAQRAGLLGLFAEPARVRQLLLDLGPWGYLVFVLSYAALQPFGVPGTVFILVAPMIWPWPVAFALSMVGTLAASVVGFSFARFVARDWITPRIPARFHAYDRALAERGFRTVVTLRFLFWMPPPLHAFFGVSRVPFWTHFWGSAVGYVPPLLATAYFGERWFAMMRDAPAWAWVALGVVVLVVGLLAWRHRTRRGEPG